MEVGRGDGGGAAEAEAAAVEAAQVMERKEPAHVTSARCTSKVTEQIIVIIIRHYAPAIPAFCPVLVRLSLGSEVTCRSWEVGGVRCSETLWRG